MDIDDMKGKLMNKKYKILNIETIKKKQQERNKKNRSKKNENVKSRKAKDRNF